MLIYAIGRWTLCVHSALPRSLNMVAQCADSIPAAACVVRPESYRRASSSGRLSGERMPHGTLSMH